MKKNTYAVKGPKGVTLIELTVVIAIILLLISILFIGAKFYKDGADKSACIVNINGIQKAARSVQNLNNKDAGDALAATDFSGDQSKPLPALPSCPTGGTAYTLSATYPDLGSVVAVCADEDFGGTTADVNGTEESAPGADDAVAGDSSVHAPSSIQGW